jgi:hypothetical protein
MSETEQMSEGVAMTQFQASVSRGCAQKVQNTGERAVTGDVRIYLFIHPSKVLSTVQWFSFTQN